VQINPNSPQVRSNLAMTLAALGRPADALTAVERRLRSRPTVSRRSTIAATCCSLDRAADACGLRARDGDDPALRSIAAMRWWRLDATRTRWRNSTNAADPAHAETRQPCALLALGRCAEALEASTARLRPNDVKALTCRALTLHAPNREAIETAPRRLPATNAMPSPPQHGAARSATSGVVLRRNARRRQAVGSANTAGAQDHASAPSRALATPSISCDTRRPARGAKVPLEVQSELTALLASRASPVVAWGAAGLRCALPAASLPRAANGGFGIPADVLIHGRPERIAKWRAR
jgi:hypothetical protein